VQTLSPSAHVVNGQFHSPRNGGWGLAPVASKRMPRKVGTPAPAHVVAVDDARRQRVAAQLIAKGVANG